MRYDEMLLIGRSSRVTTRRRVPTYQENPTYIIGSVAFPEFFGCVAADQGRQSDRLVTHAAPTRIASGTPVTAMMVLARRPVAACSRRSSRP